jgi:hypothetical protein
LRLRSLDLDESQLIQNRWLTGRQRLAITGARCSVEGSIVAIDNGEVFLDLATTGKTVLDSAATELEKLAVPQTCSVGTILEFAVSVRRSLLAGPN